MPGYLLGPTLEEVQFWLRSSPVWVFACFVLSVEAVNARLGRVLVVDETRHSGGVGEGIVSALVEHRFAGRIARVSGVDSYIPLGDAANTVLLTEDDIAHGVRQLLE